MIWWENFENKAWGKSEGWGLQISGLTKVDYWWVWSEFPGWSWSQWSAWTGQKRWRGLACPRLHPKASRKDAADASSIPSTSSNSPSHRHASLAPPSHPRLRLILTSWIAIPNISMTSSFRHGFGAQPIPVMSSPRTRSPTITHERTSVLPYFWCPRALKRRIFMSSRPDGLQVSGRGQARPARMSLPYSVAS